VAEEIHLSKLPVLMQHLELAKDINAPTSGAQR